MAEFQIGDPIKIGVIYNNELFCEDGDREGDVIARKTLYEIASTMFIGETLLLYHGDKAPVKHVIEKVEQASEGSLVVLKESDGRPLPFHRTTGWEIEKEHVTKVQMVA